MMNGLDTAISPLMGENHVPHLHIAQKNAPSRRLDLRIIAHRAGRHIDQQPVVRRVIDHHPCGDGLKVRTQEIDVPAMHIRLSRLNDAPCLPDEIGQRLLALALLYRPQRLARINWCGVAGQAGNLWKLDERHQIFLCVSTSMASFRSFSASHNSM